ncbi:NepR family anti-sigma factor [Pseudooceanicola sp. C21-150M6]|uniref:NepR family anti-sigma factor n=1 Tax=Pseudooceanicola sp. C21-150M6 TaxID=3434355 RepID=UPI003D7F9B02
MELNSQLRVKFPENRKCGGKKVGIMAHDSENDHVLRQIDENLKRVYQQRVEEELPDRFKDLIAKLKDQDRKDSNA